MQKLFHGSCHYPELWPEARLDDDIAEMKRAGLNLVRIGEFAWSRMEPEEGRISLDYFVRVMDRFHAAGLGVVFCTPTPTPPVWLTHGRPERCFVDADGRTMSHGARQHASYEDPAVRAACRRIVEACARALGRHPALVAWQVDNELKCHVAEDFNPSAVARWPRWLERRYGTIDRLNDAWGAEIWSERYQGFDQVPPPRPTPFLHNAALSTAWRVFQREITAEFLGEQCALLRRHSAAPITHNFGLGFAVDLERMSAGLDFVSFDDYPDHTQWARMIFNCDLFRAAKPGRAFWLMETSVAHNGWLTHHEPAHPPGFLVAEAVSAWGLGAQTVNYWLWRQQRSGCELPHSAVLSAWGRPSIGYESVRAVERARGRLEPLVLGSVPAPAEVALTWSDLGRAMMLTEPIGGTQARKVDYLAILQDWHRLLLDAGLHRDVRFEGAALDGLKLLVTPAMPHAGEAFLGRVEAFVRAGGVWICGPLTGLRTAEHGVPTDAGLGRLDRLAGVETVFVYPVTGTDAIGDAFGLTAPLEGMAAALRPAGPETRSVGALKTGLAPGLAFITERRVGQGAIVLVGAQPEGPAGRVMLARLVAHYAAQAGVTCRFEVSAGTVVCPRRSEDGRDLWIVQNMDGTGGRVQLPRAAADALTDEKLAAGTVEIGPYAWRAVRF
ncbi:MAG TPA: beta-galactosidase [Opitutaceae bacterium]|nr:beta-galactosidase [Opitutaceae bacterium]